MGHAVCNKLYDPVRCVNFGTHGSKHCFILTLVSNYIKQVKTSLTDSREVRGRERKRHGGSKTNTDTEREIQEQKKRNKDIKELDKDIKKYK